MLQELQKTLTVKNILLAILGLVLMGLGISLYMSTNLGVGSWDVLHMNLTGFYDVEIAGWQFTVGTWIFVVGTIVILISQLIYRNLYGFFSIITGLIMGLFIDMWFVVYKWTGIFTGLEELWMRWLLFFFAIITLGSGIALLIISKLPPSPIDFLMLTYMRRFKVNFNTAKFLTELTAFTTALIIGTINGNPFNNVGLGTFISLFAVGMVIQRVTYVLTNYPEFKNRIRVLFN